MAPSPPEKAKPADSKPAESKSSKDDIPPTPRDLRAELKKNISLLERAVQTTQLRLVGRVLRNNYPLRRLLPPAIIAEALKEQVQSENPVREIALKVLTELPPSPEAAANIAPMEVDTDKPKSGKVASKTASDKMTAPMEVDKAKAESTAPTAPAKPVKPAVPLFLPEVECYLLTLAVTSSLRAKRTDLALQIVTPLLVQIRQLNRRTLDPLAAKVVFYFTMANEKVGKISELRPLLTALYRTACLCHDAIGQATVLNLLLRSLLADNLSEQAGNLVARTNFPEGASNNQLCRYLYYVGRIQAIQLDYSEAYSKLNQASRKAPADTALDFRRAVSKLLIIVQLLLGDIPERATFNQPGLRQALTPYLSLTNVVRHGDLLEFEKVLDANAPVFKADKTYTLIMRLGHNVIKTGLRRVSLSYSRITLKEIASKLHLEDVASAEFVCAKAIKDGVIDAVIDHEHAYLRSRELNDVYATSEPQQAFHKRITFCLDVHNEAVRAMRFPATAFHESVEKQEEGERTEEELAELEENMDEGF